MSNGNYSGPYATTTTYTATSATVTNKPARKPNPNKILCASIRDDQVDRWIYHAMNYLAKKEKTQKSKIIKKALLKYLHSLGDLEMNAYADSESATTFASQMNNP